MNQLVRYLIILRYKREKTQFKKKKERLEEVMTKKDEILKKHDENFCKELFDLIFSFQILAMAGALFQILHSDLFN